MHTDSDVLTIVVTCNSTSKSCQLLRKQFWGLLMQLKDKDNKQLGLSASLLAGEIAFRGYFSKDTTPLGPEAAADPSTFIVPWRRSSPTGKVQVQRSQCYYYSPTMRRIRPCNWSGLLLVSVFIDIRYMVINT